MSPVPTIAIVDDDQAMREALDDMVKSCGYESRLFSSAEEFLSLEQRDSIDCMLLDVKMPGLSGLELQAQLNTEPPKPPIIFMTSYHDERTRSAAMEGGALAFLGKPVEFDCLIAALEKALGKG
ncbi:MULTISPECIES: response regulator transcription factor [Rhizobium/Agrobacterium group]|uniref:DNA-binding response regulator, LuxR family n=1 Tax=Neorhizobium galegae bv. orientalis str. HAMBI 540 TaxID=1028800 RepID=A0A068SSL7_NEOGA|nr:MULTISPECIES: response regulator [Rhizobium/Agrobacterium group]EUB96819.1 response regulator receiver protein [Rhizobium sp. CF080]MCQ1571419.1 response regulator [Neorhizobium galegae]MCQ1855851.1 response regulator [Neorhizobium galegae]CDN48844.1 DNA-binding response regulator, LuxR family [Neorhizobium galegae bv. orientalis str. HAMBI 540]